MRAPQRIAFSKFDYCAVRVADCLGRERLPYQQGTPLLRLDVGDVSRCASLCREVLVFVTGEKNFSGQFGQYFSSRFGNGS